MSIKKYRRNKREKEFIPKNPEKYVGTYPIICRSSWEYRVCEWCDSNNNIVEWSSEGHRIRYIDPYNPRRSRLYYPDFYIKVGNKRFIVEVKPEKDCRPPSKIGNKSKKTIAIQEQTFYINQAKFKAAKEYCKKLGMKFIILTEKQLFRS